MFELIQSAGESFYIQSPAKIGLVKTGENEVCLIDSGNDKDAGKKVKRLLDAQNWRLRAIFNTHSHADHIGGNKYLQTQTGCQIYAPTVECAFTNYPILEPACLYGGFPPKELRHKFLMAQESSAQTLNDAVLPDGWERVPLPGHTFDMVGFRTPDNVVYLADCLSSEETLRKYQIVFLTDVNAYLQTLENVKSMQAVQFVPAHAQPAENMAPLVQKNIEKVYEVAEMIRSLCREPITFESILQHLFSAYGLAMSFEQYALVGSTVRSYLTWLKESGELRAFFDNHLLLWQA